MAKLCNSYCKPICDTCINYQDEYRDIQKIWDFAGHGKGEVLIYEIKFFNRNRWV